MLIGLVGIKGCGKDTAAGFLRKHGFIQMAFADDLYGEVATAFGVTPHFLARREFKETPLERLSLRYCREAAFVAMVTQKVAEACKALREDAERAEAAGGIERVKNVPRSPRWLLQQWGTEYRRTPPGGHPAYWVERIAHRLEAKPKSSSVVLSDVRFPEEVELVRARGGVLVRVRRRKVEEAESSARAAGQIDALHPSETALRSAPVDFDVENVEGHPEHMQEALEAYLLRLKSAA